MKVYVLTHCDISDSFLDTMIVGIFTSEEKAISSLGYEAEFWERREWGLILFDEDSRYSITPYNLDKKYTPD